jgi:hypothetical protein
MALLLSDILLDDSAIVFAHYVRKVAIAETGG